MRWNVWKNIERLQTRIWNKKDLRSVLKAEKSFGNSDETYFFFGSYLYLNVVEGWTVQTRGYGTQKRMPPVLLEGFPWRFRCDIYTFAFPSTTEQHSNVLKYMIIHVIQHMIIVYRTHRISRPIVISVRINVRHVVNKKMISPELSSNGTRTSSAEYLQLWKLQL